MNDSIEAPTCLGCGRTAPDPRTVEAGDWQTPMVLHSRNAPQELQLGACPDCAAEEAPLIEANKRYGQAIRDASAKPTGDPAVEAAAAAATRLLEDFAAQDQAWRHWATERERGESQP